MKIQKNDAYLFNNLLNIIREKGIENPEDANPELDLWKVSLDPQGSLLMGKLILDLIEREVPNCKGIAGLAVGADPILNSVLSEAYHRGNNLEGVLLREDHAMKSSIEGKEETLKRRLEGGTGLEKGDSIVVLDDFTVTGESMKEAVDFLFNEAGFEVEAVLSVVDYGQGAYEYLKENGMYELRSLFTMDDITKNNKIEMTVYEEIKKEREKQKKKWGGEGHDSKHGAWDWTSIITSEVGEAIRAGDTSSLDWDRYRQQLIKIAAVAVAAVENLDKEME